MCLLKNSFEKSFMIALEDFSHLPLNSKVNDKKYIGFKSIWREIEVTL